MKIQDYCTNVEHELATWRGKLGQIDEKIGDLPCGAKEKMVGNIEELHMLMGELDDRISALKTSCPTEWRPVREEITSQLGAFNEKYHFATREFVDYDFGG